ncbi:alpha/beta hydrolase [Bradyrhizobium lablabi]|uniref:alpha/beta hydrolase n=1 Tax=Bradyrhizobium lablabi TaxID=722472 RepID=UPI001BA82C12|nr:alpha/beta hydrolase [Bradyrhizobium lablabi]MBR1119951.1 alpha/beta hydrolase [Bradyrhizobium lablabi]
MTQADGDIALDSVERAIRKIQTVYGNWSRQTTVAQMRSDWDAAFSGCTVPVSCRLVSAGGVDGEWIVPADAPRDKAILYFHGGGFRLGSIASHRDLIARIAEAGGCRALAINYRLAPEHRFPAALEDALTAYAWMLEQGLAPKDIALAGDSAGGNLVLTTMLSLRDRGEPLPAAGVLMSPWTDLAATGGSFQSRAGADPIHQRSMILALAKGYIGEGGDPLNPLASPLYGDLKGLPPLLIHAGDRETARDDATMLAEKARAAGVDVELKVWDGMIHVFQMFPEIPQAWESITVIAAFLRRHLCLEVERAG